MTEKAWKILEEPKIPDVGEACPGSTKRGVAKEDRRMKEHPSVHSIASLLLVKSCIGYIVAPVFDVPRTCRRVFLQSITAYLPSIQHTMRESSSAVAFRSFSPSQAPPSTLGGRNLDIVKKKVLARNANKEQTPLH